MTTERTRRTDRGRGALRVLLSRALCLATVLVVDPRGARAEEAVDLELVIATDVSQSIDADEATLQRRGIAEAFQSPEVVKAIRSGFLGRIGVAYLDWSSREYNKVVIDWSVIHDEASASAFAATLLNAPLTYGRRTSISDAITFAREMIETNNLEGTRRVIDVSGDGPNNAGEFVDRVRDATIARRITINGLPILDRGTSITSRFNLPDLDLYYRGCVIGGSGAFVVVASSFEDFARAIRRKLILEIAESRPENDDRPLVPHRNRLLIQVASPGEGPVPAPGYVYPQGCDIGERLRRSWFDP